MKWMFLVDGGTSVGLGHLSRCENLARELRRFGEQVSFLLPIGAERFLRDAWRLNCFDPAQSGGVEKGLAEITANDSFDVIVIDSYRIGESVRRLVRSMAQSVVAFDDVGYKPLDADIIVNASPAAEDDWYRRWNADSELLLGTNYLTLEKSFSSDRLPSIERDGLIVSMGGSDPRGITNSVVMAFDQIIDAKIPFTIVYGAAYSHAKLLPDFSSRRQVTVFSAISDMAVRLKTHQYAIVAAGSTMFECAASASPFAAIVVAENQIATANYFRDHYDVPLFELVTGPLKSDSLDKFCAVVARQIEDVKRLQCRGEALWRDFHGNGAQNLAGSLMKSAAA